MSARGRLHTLDDGRRAMATVHPSRLLRQRGETAAAAVYRRFVADLSVLAEADDSRPCSLT